MGNVNLEIVKNVGITKSGDGWTGRSIIKDVNGYGWQISTFKGLKGIVNCYAQAGRIKMEDSHINFSFLISTNPFVKMASSNQKVTEKLITDLHKEGLKRFYELEELNELPNPAYEIQRGQIIFFNGDGQSEYFHEKKAIYKIEDYLYHYINLDTLKLGDTENIKNIIDKSGNGYYYKQEDRIDLNILDELVNTAKKKVLEEQLKISAAPAKINGVEKQKPLKIEQAKEQDLTKSNFVSHKGYHAKKKHDLFIISIVNKVSLIKFNELRAIAKKNNGYYSSYSREGAIPGFQFKTKENADLFFSKVAFFE